ncbi:MAG: metal-dependent transcriptional regulator [Ruminococcus sp.]|nr:metal-dependent transcriptional regulator [Ruminococcus sp.]
MRESGEDYLETILIIKNRKGYVRAVDIAEELGYSKPSISRAVSILKQSGFIDIENGHIHLTEIGRERAEEIYHRHTVIRRFFVEILGVGEKTAELDACRTEHALSDETFEKLQLYIENYKK